jgi:hypothetical protein
MTSAIRTSIVCGAMLAIASAVAPVRAEGSPPTPDVFVIGALHELHESESCFSYDDVRRMLERIAADVWVLEVRPDELANRSATPGRPEYPAVIWPMLEKRPVLSIAMEPGGDEFKRITQAAGAGIEAARRADPAPLEFLDRLESMLDGMSMSRWVELADTQDSATADLARAIGMLRMQIYGAEYSAAQHEWERFMAARAAEAITANPGKRIVVLGSFRNRGMLSESIRQAAANRIVNMEEYLRRGKLVAIEAPRSSPK